MKTLKTPKILSTLLLLSALTAPVLLTGCQDESLDVMPAGEVTAPDPEEAATATEGDVGGDEVVVE